LTGTLAGGRYQFVAVRADIRKWADFDYFCRTLPHSSGCEMRFRGLFARLFAGVGLYAAR
jgi:hypothetical protein